jgi:hypothetical protein
MKREEVSICIIPIRDPNLGGKIFTLLFIIFGGGEAGY